MDDLMELLENVPDKYDDFISGMRCFLKNDEANQKKMIEYLKAHPESKSDDVLDYLDEL